MEAPPALNRVPSAFARAEECAHLASGAQKPHHHHHGGIPLPPDTTSSSSGNLEAQRPRMLKLPRAESHNAHNHHWAETSGDKFHHDLHTPAVDGMRSLQGQFSHPASTPQVLSVRQREEGDFRSPLASAQVTASRRAEEKTFKAPPNTPQVTALRSAEGSFKAAPDSPQLDAIRQLHEDPFKKGGVAAPPGGSLGRSQAAAAASTAAAAAGSTAGVRSMDRSAAAAAVAGLAQNAIRSQMEGFRSTPITPTLNALRERLEAFVSSDVAAADSPDPRRAAIARASEDPFNHRGSVEAPEAPPPALQDELFDVQKVRRLAVA